MHGHSLAVPLAIPVVRCEGGRQRRAASCSSFAGHRIAICQLARAAVRDAPLRPPAAAQRRLLDCSVQTEVEPKHPSETTSIDAMTKRQIRAIEAWAPAVSTRFYGGYIAIVDRRHHAMTSSVGRRWTQHPRKVATNSSRQEAAARPKPTFGEKLRPFAKELC